MAKAKPGKYEEVLKDPDLKHAPPADVPYQMKVEKVKEELAPLDALGVANHYVELRKGNGVTILQAIKAVMDHQADEKEPTLTPLQEQHLLVACLGQDGIKALEYICNMRIEACNQLLVASQDRGDEPWGKYGVKPNALRFEDGSTIRVTAEPYGQVKDKEAFRLWCIKEGYETQLQLWPSTMNAIAKERRLNGDPDPDGIEVFRKESVKYIGVGSAGDYE